MNYDVVLAVYNGEKYLRQQFESIMNQTLKPEKIYIRDDGSTDSSLDIIDDLNKIGTVEVLDANVNVGYIKNFEILSKACRSDIVFFCDQDDYWAPSKAETIIKRFNEHSQVNAVFSDAYVVNEKLEELFKLSDINGLSEASLSVRKILQRNFVTGATLAVRRNFLHEHLPFDKNIPHDYYLAMAALLDGTLYFEPQCLIKYRQHESNVIGVGKSSFLQKISSINSAIPLWGRNILQLSSLAKVYNTQFDSETIELLTGREDLRLRNKLDGIKSVLSNVNGYRKILSIKHMFFDVLYVIKCNKVDGK